MLNMPLSEFIEKCNDLSDKMRVEYRNGAPLFVFSNTSSGESEKSFAITHTQLISVFENIIDNQNEFSSHEEYDQNPWRTLLSEHIEDDVARALATVQTLPFFELLNKVIVISNGIEHTYKYKKMSLKLEHLQAAKSYLIQESSITYPIQKTNATIPSIKKEHAGCNIIFYGAPGTGKSHEINKKVKDDLKITTVFHPDTQYSDFVGSLKPTMTDDKITYQFRPGPFTTALIMALSHENKHVYLIIEELNRAPAAAVFGELFQLLDRENGASKYSIDATDPDMLNYINSKTSLGKHLTQLYLPNNLTIFATMNSSDQAVMPLDTAFKRRWSFQYLKIDFNNKDISEQQFKVMTSQGEYMISWKKLANDVINAKLKSMRIPEDRLLGPFFLSQSELKSLESANQALCGKLFVYLWDDVLRHKGRDLFFADHIFTFGDLHSCYVEGKSTVFSESIDELIILHGQKTDNIDSLDGNID